MMNFDGKELHDLFEAAFGRDISTLTVDQARFLTNFAKHCRGRCRSNVALNNYLNRNFKHLKFQQEINDKGFEVLHITSKTP